MAKHNAAEQETLGSAMNKTELFFENNGRLLMYILLGVILVVGAFFGYRALIVAPRAEKAAEMMTQAQYRFESARPNYEQILHGDDQGAGLLEVIEKYGSTPQGNLAKHYAGLSYLKLGDLDNALVYLSKYSPVKGIPGALINAQNYGVQGDIAVDKDEYAKAVTLYEKAVKAADNDLTAPMYLYKAGLAEQAAGNAAKATAYYQQILDKHPASFYAREAEKRIGTVK